MYKEVIQHELTQGDVDTLLEQTIKMMDSTRETISQLCGRLMNAVATINEEESKKELKGEKQKQSVETANIVGEVHVEEESTSDMMMLVLFCLVNRLIGSRYRTLRPYS